MVTLQFWAQQSEIVLLGIVESGKGFHPSSVPGKM